jgi:hypothetical protein
MFIRIALLAVEEVEAPAGTCGGREVVHVFDEHNVAVEGVDTTFWGDAAWVCIPQPTRANNKISTGISLARMVVSLHSYAHPRALFLPTASFFDNFII